MSEQLVIKNCDLKDIETYDYGVGFDLHDQNEYFDDIFRKNSVIHSEAPEERKQYKLQ